MRRLTMMLLVMLAGCSERPAALAPEQARQQLTERNWIDLWPTSADQRLRLLRFTPKMGGGVYQDRTLYRGSFELFVFGFTGSEIRFKFPDSGERATTRYHIVPVSEPKPFTHKLVLERSPRGPKIYYGYDERAHQLPSLALPSLASGAAPDQKR